MIHPARPTRLTPRPPPETLRLGFVPVVHAAPLLAARELGIFQKHGLRVRLSREVGWATIREKIVSGELHAAQALAPMPLATTLGLNCLPTPAVTALVLNLHGNAIVLSRAAWRACDGQPRALPTLRKHRGEPLTLGIVYPHSSQLFLIRQWCREAGLVPDVDFRLVVVPPPQVVAHLAAGHLDGACVGEPWGSLAVRKSVGVIAALSADLAPGHAEKVLMVRESFALDRAPQHAALVGALLESCRWCSHPDHREELAALLAARDALGMPAEVIRPALTGCLDLGANRSVQHPDALVFHGPDVNAPSPARIAWIASELAPETTPGQLRAVYRDDLFLRYTASSEPSTPPSQASHELIPSLA